MNSTCTWLLLNQLKVWEQKRSRVYRYLFLEYLRLRWNEMKNKGLLRVFRQQILKTFYELPNYFLTSDLDFSQPTSYRNTNTKQSQVDQSPPDRCRPTVLRGLDMFSQEVVNPPPKSFSSALHHFWLWIVRSHRSRVPAAESSFIKSAGQKTWYRNQSDQEMIAAVSEGVWQPWGYIQLWFIHQGLAESASCGI